MAVRLGWTGELDLAAKGRKPFERPRRLAVLAAALVSFGFGDTVAARAQNLVVNSLFHEDTANWGLTLGTQLFWTSLADEGGCGNSGSALVSSALLSGEHYAGLSQCIPLSSESILYARVRHQGYGSFSVNFNFWEISCVLGPLGSEAESFAQSPVQWQDATLSALVPPTANSVRIVLVAVDAAPHGLSVDGVFLSEEAPIFLDDFDGNDASEASPCRWSP